ncbi:MAG TPA: polysaccharide deacetylase family protein [Polyangiaceae bacterium]|nr:polysaccharide deacetylase family protein [Polyangiaceae bacterium]
MNRLCAISVNLDSAEQYHDIHALPPLDPEVARGAYDRALRRVLDFGAEHRIPLTLFVVARDALHLSSALLLREAVAKGHEIGNHSKDHLRDLVNRSRDEQVAQVEGARELLECALAVTPAGFRAPGYIVTDELLEVVRHTGHRYDSSVLPSPAFHAARAVAAAALGLRGRRTTPVVAAPNALRAPRRPYRIGHPYTVHGDGLVELPVQVTRGPRLPFVGTGLILAGQLGARALTELVIGEPFINLALHALDFLTLDDGLDALRGYQPDLRLRLAKKRRILASVIEHLRAAGYTFVSLERAAETVV